MAGNDSPQLSMAESKDETCSTFLIHKEGHTMGNALRYVVSKHKDVEFCGYSIHHPSNEKVHLRIQTVIRGKERVDCRQVLADSLDVLMGICDHMKNTFAVATEKSMNEESTR
mmetsp:Transcript_5743/g.9573  ORF Transcript_5743/g.9573 Transcript_5743/m.9573 type:complete len:113 (-) Transcript_5743:243-581(-)